MEAYPFLAQLFPLPFLTAALSFVLSSLQIVNILFLSQLVTGIIFNNVVTYKGDNVC